MYNFLWEYSLYWCFYPNFKSGRLELLDNIYVNMSNMEQKLASVQMNNQ